MSELTREQVEEKVRNKESVHGFDLSGIDLSELDLTGAWLFGADLSMADLARANLSEANLSEANFSGVNLRGASLSKANLTNADLTGANLMNANLSWANLLEADFSGANISGTNIYRTSTIGWKIEGIICTHIYNWDYKSGKEKTRRNFGPGEFEELYKAFPKIELIFKPDYINLNLQALLNILNRINQELPEAKATWRRMEKTTDAIVTIAVGNRDKLNEVEEKIVAGYQKLADEVKGLRHLLSNKSQFDHQKALIRAEDRYLVEHATQIEQNFYGPTTIIKDNKEVREVRTGDTIDIDAHTVQLGGQAYHLGQAEGQAKLLEAIFGKLDNPQEFLTLLEQASKQAVDLSPEAQAGIKTEAERLLKSQDAGFKAKLRKTWDKISSEGWEVGKGILVDVISEVIRKSLVL